MFTGGANLAMVEEEAKVGTSNSILKVRVGKNNIRRLAAEFESDAFKVARCGSGHDLVTNFSGAGEGHLVDLKR